jgi:DNA repair protein NreA
MGHSVNFGTTGIASRDAAGHMNKKLFAGKPKFRKRKEIVYQTNFQVKKHFTGSSPPEIFVGRYNYPNVNAGILSPDFHDNTEDLSMPEVWHEKKFGIGDILTRRSKLIYGRFKTGIKKSVIKNRFKDLMQEIAMAYRPVSTEVFLKKNPSRHLEVNNYSSVITNLAPLDNVRLQENTKVKKKVDYLVGDTHVKSATAMNELHAGGIPTSNIQKILSAGLLGIQNNRRLVPTRWSITAVDDTLGKHLLKRIRYYKEVDEVQLFNATYCGNHYEILILPGSFSFEIIEADVKMNRVNFWQDYERFYGRKTYADEVTGGYFVARLAVCEYLDRIKRQGSVFVFRETTSDYYAHLGVGILRECCRDALSQKGEKFTSKEDAFIGMQDRLNLNSDVFKQKSVLMKDYGLQRKLWDF